MSKPMLQPPRRSSAAILVPAISAAMATALSCTVATPPGTPPATAANAGAATAAAPFPGAGVPAAIPSTIPFVSLEGPFWVTKGNYLLFSDVVEANAVGARIYRFDPGTRAFSVLPYPAPTPPEPATSTNGLAVDAQGALLACERYNARLVRVAANGKLSVLADHGPAVGGQPGAPLSAPNDLAVRTDGNIYFTDNDWGARPGVPHGPTALYRLPPNGPIERVMELIKPNGVALSPDQSTLYLGSDELAKVWKMPLDAAGAPGAPTLLVDGPKVAGGIKVADGICIDDPGNLYITSNSEDVKAIVVFDSSGRPLGRIALPFAPSNCTFGGPDRKTMYVTTLHAIYEVAMSTPGLP
jgi:gluconolactonase